MAVGPALGRLLSPASIAVVGGRDGERAVAAARSIGFTGPVWGVNPRRGDLAGAPCFPTVDALPEVPDAAFVSVPAQQAVSVVADLRRLGVGGVVCHSSGFAETGPVGAALQADLVAAAGPMPVLGPNCLGLLNYLDGAALWADQHGGRRVSSGVALVTQSGNIGQNLTMQRRGLPLAALLTLGNEATVDVPAVLEALLEDDRITAVGMYLEAMPEPLALARLARTALRRGVPLVALKTGRTTRGAQAALTHTGSLVGSDVACDALLRQLGIARVDDLEELVETLILLHVHGSLPGNRVFSASCSGGEAALVADLAEPLGVELPPLSDASATALAARLGERVVATNPLDYHTYDWGDGERLRDVFGAAMQQSVDLSMLLLDLPRPDRCDDLSWRATMEAFVRAGTAAQARTAVVSTLSEGMPEVTADELVARGVAPLHSIRHALRAVAAAAQVGAARSTDEWTPAALPLGASDAGTRWLDEVEGKRLLAAAGIGIPAGHVVVDPAGAVSAARSLGGATVVKALSSGLHHKSDVDGVVLGITDPAAAGHAAADLLGRGLADACLVEAMVDDVVAELVVAVRVEPSVGFVLTVGGGGVLVEVTRDTASLILPASDAEVLSALQRLQAWRLVGGARGRRGDVGAVVEAVQRVGRLVTDPANGLVEIEVNPLLVRSTDVVAVDVLARVVARAGDEVDGSVPAHGGTPTSRTPHPQRVGQRQALS